MKFEMIKKTVIAGVGRSGLVLKKYSPEILMGVGVVGAVTSTVLACKATLKLDAIVDETKVTLDKINTAKPKLSEDKYSDSDYKKDLAVTYAQSAVQIVKLYAPALTVGVVSISCLLGAHGIMKKRNVAVVAAYNAMAKSFKDYRKRVTDEYGVDVDRKFRTGVVKTETVKELDANGDEIEVINEYLDPNGHSVYARFFDESCSQWDKHPDYNATFVKCQQNWANDLLNSRKHLFLNEVYDNLGMPRTKAGQSVGWVKDGKNGGDSFVDFGLFDGEKQVVRQFVNGDERSILIDFNVDGIILDLIENRPTVEEELAELVGPQTDA